VIRILDVCCGAGGASAGYAQAGFDVVGVDIAPQPQYPYEFHQGDAVEFIKAHGHEFDAIHASFPCQRYTKGAGRWGTRESHPDLIGPGRDAILATRLPYVIENVEEARTALISPIRLCGQMFTLGVFRHRLFEMPWFTGAHPPHRTHNGRIGDGKYVTVTGNPGGHSTRDGIQHGRLADWRTAMGITWMGSKALAQAIPPAYTHWVGQQLRSVFASD
jgi:hypothetical protein